MMVGLTPFDHLRALVMADVHLQNQLAIIDDVKTFQDAALQIAAAHNIVLTLETLAVAVRPDPLGLSRWMLTPSVGTALPPENWLPVQTGAIGDQFFIDWAHFGDCRLSEAFFEDSLRRALRRPFNKIFRYRTTLQSLCEMTERAPLFQPKGFIFHMSRCGSTLVAQMLSTLPQHAVISEAAPIDAILQFGGRSLEERVNNLRAILYAFCRRRVINERNVFFKLDSWHVLALPLFRLAFPCVPWTYLYREPIEVLESQIRQRGIQTVSEFVPPAIYGIDNYQGMRGDEYCARVLGSICGAAAEHFQSGGGQLVNYCELPEAVATRILPHFGVEVSATDCDAMRQMTKNDAKRPHTVFTPDSANKRLEATHQRHAQANEHVGTIYRRLETLRLASSDLPPLS